MLGCSSGSGLPVAPGQAGRVTVTVPCIRGHQVMAMGPAVWGFLVRLMGFCCQFHPSWGSRSQWQILAHWVAMAGPVIWGCWVAAEPSALGHRARTGCPGELGQVHQVVAAGLCFCGHQVMVVVVGAQQLMVPAGLVMVACSVMFVHPGASGHSGGTRYGVSWWRWSLMHFSVALRHWVLGHWVLAALCSLLPRRTLQILYNGVLSNPKQ